MRRTLLAAAAVWAGAALAQEDVSVDIEAGGMPAVQMNVRTTRKQAPPAEAQPAQKQPPSRTLGAEAFALSYSPLGGGVNQIKVLTPEGAGAQVWNEAGTLEGTWDVPFNFKGHGGTYYRIILTLPSGEVVYDRKVEVREYLTGVLKAKGAPARAAPPPVVAVAAGPGAMAPGDFEALLEAVNGESFSDGKLSTVSTAADSAWFTVDQVGRLVDALDHSGDKVKVVEITRSHLVDKANGFKLFQHFTFSGDKDKVKQLLK